MGEEIHIQENESAHVSELIKTAWVMYSVKRPTEVFVSKTTVTLQLFFLHIIIQFSIYKILFCLFLFWKGPLCHPGYPGTLWV